MGESLSWHGALSLDVVLAPDGPRVIDVNPRLVEPGNAWRAGVDLVGATGDDPERLVVSLFALRSRFGWPWPGRASLAARFGIDRAGRLIRITTD